MLEGGQDVTPLSLLDALPDPTDIRGLDTPLAVAVFRHLKDGRDEDGPWGYTSASIAGAALDMPRQYTSSALSSLHDAGWVERVEPTGTGVYRFVEDPREGDDVSV